MNAKALITEVLKKANEIANKEGVEKASYVFMTEKGADEFMAKFPQKDND